MEIKVNREGSRATFSLDGDIDEAGAALLRKQFQELGTDGLSDLVLDFSRVGYIGSSGIGQLILFYKQLAAVNGKARLINVSREIGELLRDLDIHKVIAIND